LRLLTAVLPTHEKQVRRVTPFELRVRGRLLPRDRARRAARSGVDLPADRRAEARGDEDVAGLDHILSDDARRRRDRSAARRRGRRGGRRTSLEAREDYERPHEHGDDREERDGAVDLSTAARTQRPGRWWSEHAGRVAALARREERTGERAGALVALRWLAGKRTAHDLIDLLAHPDTCGAQRWRRPVEPLAQEVVGLHLGVSRASREQLVRDEAEAVDVGSFARRLARDAFRRDVSRGAYELVLARTACRARDAEVGELRRAARRARATPPPPRPRRSARGGGSGRRARGLRRHHAEQRPSACQLTRPLPRQASGQRDERV